MQAIILKKNVFSEGNEIVTFFTRELGKVRAVARGVKSNKSKLGFALETLFYSEIELVHSRNLHTITGARPLEVFKSLRQHLALVYKAFYASELLIKSSADEHPNPELFDLFLSLLRHLDQNKPARHYCVELFILKALDLSGYGLDLTHCLSCRRKLLSSQSFSKDKGGFLCSDCAVKTTDTMTVSAALLKYLLAVYKLPFEQIDLFGSENSVDLGQLHDLSNSFAVHILERNLNAGQYIV